VLHTITETVTYPMKYSDRYDGVTFYSVQFLLCRNIISNMYPGFGVLLFHASCKLRNNFSSRGQYMYSILQWVICKSLQPVLRLHLDIHAAGTVGRCGR
jgi:hypothetical protein